MSVFFSKFATRSEPKAPLFSEEKAFGLLFFFLNRSAAISALFFPLLLLRTNAEKKKKQSKSKKYFSIRIRARSIFRKTRRRTGGRRGKKKFFSLHTLGFSFFYYCEEIEEEMFLTAFGLLCKISGVRGESHDQWTPQHLIMRTIVDLCLANLIAGHAPWHIGGARTSLALIYWKFSLIIDRRALWTIYTYLLFETETHLPVSSCS